MIQHSVIPHKMIQMIYSYTLFSTLFALFFRHCQSIRHNSAAVDTCPVIIEMQYSTTFLYISMGVEILGGPRGRYFFKKLTFHLPRKNVLLAQLLKKFIYPSNFLMTFF